MPTPELQYDRLDIPRPMGWFRLDVILTAVSGVMTIDWDDEYWAQHPSPQPFQHEVGAMLSYVALDDQLEIFQFGRVADDTNAGVLDQLRAIPELKELIDSIPTEDASPEETTAWYHHVIKEHPMDRLIELSPVIMEDHIRDADPVTEFMLMGGTVLGLAEDE